ncbi:MAG: PilZ domain-containing protein [Spirochaetales bacterium]|nr:PilZ domain-containing protein [Spirochaetales bacterium]
MGLEISRIEKEFIIQALWDKKIPVEIHGRKNTVSSLVKGFDDDTVELESTDEPYQDLSSGDRVRVYFSYFGNVMTFETRVIRAAEKLIVSFPKRILKNLTRKYERVPTPEDVELSFMIKETKVELTFPKTEEYDPVLPPQPDVSFNLDSLVSLVDGFKREAGERADENNMLMFRDKRPEGFEEEIISRLGKILFIPSTSEAFPNTDLDTDGKIITRYMLYTSDEDVPEGSEEVSRQHIDDYLLRKKQRGVVSELYCPVLYHQYAVGYIYLAKKIGSGVLSKYDLDYVHQFSKVLAYTLKNEGYFKGEKPTENEYKAEIIDISASGLMFMHASAGLRSLIVLYTDLKIQLRLGQRSMSIYSRVMRKIQDGNKTFYGLQFLEMQPEDFRYLFQYVYGRDFSVEDERLWEGGSEPPELNLD